MIVKYVTEERVGLFSPATSMLPEICVAVMHVGDFCDLCGFDYDWYEKRDAALKGDGVELDVKEEE